MLLQNKSATSLLQVQREISLFYNFEKIVLEIFTETFVRTVKFYRLIRSIERIK